jgi:hypothetical protein
MAIDSWNSSDIINTSQQKPLGGNMRMLAGIAPVSVAAAVEVIAAVRQRWISGSLETFLDTESIRLASKNSSPWYATIRKEIVP